MNLDFATLSTLRKTHPAWRLLMADHAPLIASFLNRVFISPNVRVMARDELIAKLEDELYHLRRSRVTGPFPAMRRNISTAGPRMTRAGCASSIPRGPTRLIST